MFDCQEGDKFVKIEIGFLLIEGMKCSEGGWKKDSCSSDQR